MQNIRCMEQYAAIKLFLFQFYLKNLIIKQKKRE